jgi:hypothetical protein
MERKIEFYEYSPPNDGGPEYIKICNDVDDIFNQIKSSQFI